jgi:hypothetical protein
VQQRGDQRHPAGPADEQQAGDVLLAEPRVPHERRRGAHGTGEQRLRRRLELLAGELHLQVERRQAQEHGRSAGEHLLRDTHVVPQFPPPAAVVGRGGVLDAGPLLVAARRGALAQPLDDRGVEVEAADVVDPVDGGHLEAGLDPAHGAGVERAGTQVVDDQRLAERDVAVEDAREVVGRRHRLGNQGDRAQPGRLRGVEQCPAPHGAPAGRIGQRRGGHDTAGDPGGLGRDVLEHGGEQLKDRHLAAAEEQPLVVDEPLGVGFELTGFEPAVVECVATHDEGPLGGGENRRRQQGRALEEKRLDPAVGPTQHRDGTGGTEVDAKTECRRDHGGKPMCGDRDGDLHISWFGTFPGGTSQSGFRLEALRGGAVQAADGQFGQEGGAVGQDTVVEAGQR